MVRKKRKGVLGDTKQDMQEDRFEDNKIIRERALESSRQEPTAAIEPLSPAMRERNNAKIGNPLQVFSKPWSAKKSQDGRYLNSIFKMVGMFLQI